MSAGPRRDDNSSLHEEESTRPRDHGDRKEGRRGGASSTANRRDGYPWSKRAPILRHITSRTTRTIHLRLGGKNYPFRVKIAEDRRGRAMGSKVEYEDLRRISDKTGISVLELQRLAKPLLKSTEQENDH